METQRIWEIDFLRGAAIVLMVVFHIIYDLAEFYAYPINYTQGIWFFTGRAAAVSFIILSGVSSNLSRGFYQRGGHVLAAALLISIVTYLFDPASYVRFGILHLLGVCMLASAIFHRLKRKTAAISAVLLTAVFFSLWFLWFISTGKTAVADTSLFIPLGITPADFRSMDYYPLIPWAGFFFCGLSLGMVFYNSKKSLGGTGISSWPPVKGLCFLGRHSLLVYLSHQPIIMCILFFIHQFLKG